MREQVASTAQSQVSGTMWGRTSLTTTRGSRFNRGNHVGVATLSGEAAAADETLAQSLPARILDEGEVIILKLRPNPLFILLNPLGSLTALALLTAIAWTTIYLSPSASGGGRVLLVGLVLIVARLLWACLEWWNRVYVLTDRRIVRRRGVLRVSLFQAPLSRVQHVTMYFSLRERLFALGTIGFATAGTGVPEAYWVTIGAPLEAYRKVLDTIDKYAGQSRALSGEA